MVQVTGAILCPGGGSTNNGGTVKIFCEENGLAFAPVQLQCGRLVIPANKRDDLAVESVRFAPLSVNAGQSVSVSFRVRSLLAANASPARARLQLTADGVLTESDPGLVPLEVNIPALSSGGFYDYPANFTVPVDLQPGTYFIGVKLVPVVPMTEINPANSVGVSASKLTVVGTGAPSLQVTPVSRDVPWGAGVVFFSIRNIGGGSMGWSASITDAPWLHFLGAQSGTADLNGSKLGVSFDRNPDTSARSGHVLVSAPGASPASHIITVTQAKTAPPPPLVTFLAFSDILSPRFVNIPFAVTITAMNGEAVQTAFNGEVSLSQGLSEASVGNVTPHSVELVNGIWDGNLSLDTPTLATRLRGEITTSGADGQSNPFTVQAPGSPTETLTVRVIRASDGAPVDTAYVTLHEPSLPDATLPTGIDGQVAFEVHVCGNVPLTVDKVGYRSVEDSVQLGGQSSDKVIRLHFEKPPVIFVPGIMGSAVGILQGSIAGLAIPILPEQYPADQSELRLMNDPRPPRWDKVGWTTLKKELESNFAVFDSPWDWRMPVSHTDSKGKGPAWRHYLKPVIERAKRETGHPKVDIVAHSMGGLLARAYIQSDFYEDDVGRLAMVGTPNEGAANAYFLWYGGDTTTADQNEEEAQQPEDVGFYEQTSRENYHEWRGGDWASISQGAKRDFYWKDIQALEELLPVYDDFLRSGKLSYPLPDRSVNPLFQLNQRPFTQFSEADTWDKVYTTVFCSGSEKTKAEVELGEPNLATYPDGVPTQYWIQSGDGTVLWKSATMTPPRFDYSASRTGQHSELVKIYASAINNFLIEGRTLTPAAPQSNGESPRMHQVPSEPDSGGTFNGLFVSLGRRCEPWIVDPNSSAAGISPSSGAFTNGWSDSEVTVRAYCSEFSRINPPAGTYSASVPTFAGEEIPLEVVYMQTNQTWATNLHWIGSTSAVSFSIEISPGLSTCLLVVPAVPPPLDVQSSNSNGVCVLTWAAPSTTNQLAYRIYGRQVADSLFRLIAVTTNTAHNTEHVWEPNSSNTNWTYAVVTASTDGTESTFVDTVMNYTPTLAGFSADPTSGTPPLVVAFKNQSVGSVTNWAWDFDSDGTIDSTEANPSSVFAEPGSYTVTLTVAGADGHDTKIEVGCVDVRLPSLGVARVLPDRTVDLALYGQTGRSYEIQASSDLRAWTTIVGLTLTNTAMVFRDTTAMYLSQRFYRVAIP